MRLPVSFGPERQLDAKLPRIRLAELCRRERRLNLNSDAERRRWGTQAERSLSAAVDDPAGHRNAPTRVDAFDDDGDSSRHIGTRPSRSSDVYENRAITARVVGVPRARARPAVAVHAVDLGLQPQRCGRAIQGETALGGDLLSCDVEPRLGD